MLDVHAPHKAIHGAGEFFLHLFTITVGLLIAVGIEAAVTRHEHTKLAREAADSMTEEIRRNLDNANSALQKIEAQQAHMKANLGWLAKIQKDPKSDAAKNATIDAAYGNASFETTAWRTAQATGAMAYMPYEQAQKFSGIYDAIQLQQKAEDVIVEDEAQFLGIIRRYPDTGAISKEEADDLAQRFGIWQGHLLQLHITARLLHEDEAAFLEHREPAHNISENIDN